MDDEHTQVDCSYLLLKLLNEKASTSALTGQSGVVGGNRPNKRPFIDFLNWETLEILQTLLVNCLKDTFDFTTSSDK